MDLSNLEVEIRTGVMLVGMGLTTVDAVVSYFKQNGTDDETLAAIQTEVQTRLARRG